MASQRELKIQINVNVANAVNALNGLLGALNNVNAAANNAAGGAKNVAAANNQAAAASKNAAAAANNHAAAQAKTAAAWAKQKAALVQLNTIMSGLKNTSKLWQQHIDENRRSAYALTIAGYQLSYAGQRVMNVFKEATASFADYDFELRRAAGASQIFDDQSATFNALNEQLHQLSIESGLFDAKQLAEGYYYWASAVGEVSDSVGDVTVTVEKMRSIIQAAALAHVDLQTATKGVVGIMAAFNMETSHTADVVEKLFYVTQKTQVEMADLFNTFKMLGPTAAQIGMTFEDTVKLAGALGDVGIKGTMAGRALRMIATRIGDPPAVMTKFLDNLVVRMGQAAEKGELLTGKMGDLNQTWKNIGKTWQEVVFPQHEFIGFEQYLNRLTEVYMHLNDEEKQRFLGIITTQAQLPSLTRLIEANSKSLQENGKDILNNAKYTHDLAEASKFYAQAVALQERSAKAVLGRLQNTITQFVHDVGEAALSVFIPMAKAIETVMIKLHEWARDSEGNLTAVFKFFVGLGMAIGTLMSLSGALLLVVGAAKLLWGTALPTLILNIMRMVGILDNGLVAAATMTDALRALRMQQILTAASTTALTVSQDAYNAAIKSGVGDVRALAIANEAYNLSLSNSKSGNKMALNGIQLIINRFTGGKGLMGVLRNAGGLFQRLGGSLLKFAKGAVIVTVVLGLLNGAIGGSKGLSVNMKDASKTAEGAVSVVRKLGDTFVGLAQGIFKVLGQAWDFLAWLGSILGKISGVTQAVQNLQTMFSGVFEFLGFLLDQFNRDWTNLTNSIAAFAETLSIWVDGFSKGKSWEQAAAERNARVLHQQEAAGLAMLALSRSQQSQELAQQAAANAKKLEEQQQYYLDGLDQQVQAANVEWTVEAVRQRMLTDLQIQAQKDRTFAALEQLHLLGEFTKQEWDIILGYFGKDAAQTGEEAGKTLVDAFTGSIMQAGGMNATRGALASLVAAMTADNNPKLARQGAEALIAYLQGFVSAAGEQAPTAADAVIGFANAAMESKFPELRQTGAASLAALISGVQSGQTDFTGLWAGLINSANQLIQSNDPVQRTLGLNQMIALAQGMIAGAPNATYVVDGTMQTILAMLQSANPAMQQSAENWMLEIALGIYKGSPAVLRQLAAFGRTVTSFATAYFGPGSLFDTVFNHLPPVPHLPGGFNVPKIHLPDKTPGGGGGRDKGKTQGEDGSWCNNKDRPPTRQGGEWLCIKGKWVWKKGGSGAGGGKDQTPLEKALEVAQQGAGLVKALRDVQGYNIKALVKSTMGGVAEGVALAIQIAEEKSKGISDKTLKHVAEFADAADKTASMLSTVKDAWDALSNWKSVPRKRIEEVIKAVTSAIEIAAEAGKDFETKQYVEAQMFSETAQKVAESIGAAATAFSGILDYHPIARRTVEKIVADMQEAVEIMVEVGAEFQQAGLDMASEFASAASTIVGAIGDAFSVFSGITDFTRPSADIVDQIVAAIRDIVHRMVALADHFGLSTDEWDAVKSFADTVSTVMGALSATWEAHNQTMEFLNQVRVGINVDQIFDQIEVALSRMRDISRGYSEGEIAKVAALAQAASGVAQALSDFFAIGANASNDPESLGRMVLDAVNAVMVIMADFVAAFEDYGYGVVMNFANGINKALDELQSSGGLSASVSALPQTMKIEHTIVDRDGVLKNANAQEVADLLSGSQFIANLVHAAKTQ